MVVAYYIEKDLDTEMYITIAPSIPSAHTMAETIDELKGNLREVITLCLEELAHGEKESICEFICLNKLEVVI